MAVDLSTMEFDEEFRSVSVKINNGKGWDYELLEATGDDATQYRNKILSGTRRFPDGSVSVQGIAETEPFLVSRCLFKRKAEDDTANWVRCTVKEVKELKSSTQKALFERAKEISSLEEDETEETIEGLERRLEELRAKKEADEESEGND